MTLQEYVDTLPEDKQFELAIKLVRVALPIWDKFADKNKLTYRDTVVGLTHNVDRLLLLKTADAVERHFRLKRVDSELYDLRRQFDDPIAALQDFDWEIPDEVQKTFYAVHNLLDACMGKGKTAFGDSTIYVSINQAVDALDTSQLLTFDQIKKLFTDTNNGS